MLGRERGAHDAVETSTPRTDAPGDQPKETGMTIGGYLLPSRKGTSIGAIGLDITMKANGESTRDAYSLFEYTIPPGVNGPPPHVHTREDESFICLAGRLKVHLGGEDYEMEHGDYMLLPRDVVHAFTNPFDEEARVISVVSPAGLERYYQALAEMPPGPRDMSKMKAIMDDFGILLRLPDAH
jgi:quercetin dioxygenase-like cupin family protein